MFAIDLSTYEGFGLVPFEATINHCLPILSRTVGVTSYLSNAYPFFLPVNYNQQNAVSCSINQLSLSDEERLQILKQNIPSLESFCSANQTLMQIFLQDLYLLL